jgi:hypothetical protein
VASGYAGPRRMLLVSVELLDYLFDLHDRARAKQNFVPQGFGGDELGDEVKRLQTRIKATIDGSTL